MTFVSMWFPHLSLAGPAPERDDAGVAVILTAAPATVRAPVAYDEGAIAASRRGRTMDAVSRLASVGALGLSVALPLLVLLGYASLPPYSHHLPEASAATALYLPLHVRHVRSGLRGVRPGALRWTLPAMAVVIVAFTPLLGVAWLYTFPALAASVLVTTRPRVSFPALACILVAVGVWAGHLAPQLGHAQDINVPAAVLDRAMMVFVLVWLVGALRRIQSARLALAEEALEAERRHADHELGRTVGAQLDSVVRSGQRALETMRTSPQQAEEELESAVEGSRRTLTQARRLLGRYQQVSSRAELDTAASLLRAAGMEVRVVVPGEALPPALDESLRTSLRAAVAQLLADETTGLVVLKLGRENGVYTLDAVLVPSTEPRA
jgi:two-component system, NarL family, sensor histidine kinase DesK